jgi:hypothetical protein
MLNRDEVREVKRRHSAELLRQPGVSGVGVEKDEAGNYVLAVHVAENAGAESWLPDVIEGCPVKIVRSGPFRPLSR